MFLQLKPGDIIDVIAPSSAHHDVSLESIEKFVSNLGYRARIRKGLIVKDADIFSANKNEVRFTHLLEALLAEDSKVIWAFRGGYGATRILSQLDNHDFSKQRKFLIGFSDITALFLYFHARYKWPYIHGRVLSQYASTEVKEEEVGCIKKILSGNSKTIRYSFEPVNKKACVPKKINAEIIGGNLSLIQCSLGTTWQINSNNKVLFIEETNERGYKIHRMLEHLKQAGVFDNIKALILGNIDCLAEPNGSSLCEAAISNFFDGVTFPVIRSKNFGHGENNYPLMMGTKSLLTLGKDVYLTFENS